MNVIPTTAELNELNRDEVMDMLKHLMDTFDHHPFVVQEARIKYDEIMAKRREEMDDKEAT